MFAEPVVRGEVVWVGDGTVEPVGRMGSVAASPWPTFSDPSAGEACAGPGRVSLVYERSVHAAMRARWAWAKGFDDGSSVSVGAAFSSL